MVPKLKQDMWSILQTNWKVWIPFQFFNFNFVPVQLQVGPRVLFPPNLRHTAALSTNLYLLWRMNSMQRS